MEVQEQLQRDRRPAALGNLRVLPDELLCAILDLLDPRDLARLACVSSVMYILCNEEPVWMNLCLKVGGLLEFRGSWKKTTLYRQNLCAGEEEECRRLLQFDGFNSLYLYRRWYRCFTSLHTFSLDNGDLERKKDLTLEVFLSAYDGKKPVLLTELAENWSARTTWTVDQLEQNYGDVEFRISQRSSKNITMKLKDYLSYMKVQHDEDPLYIFDDKFAEAAPKLLEDYRVPHLFQEDYFDILDHDQKPPFRWLIIGPERSGASWHVDPALTSAWNTLLSGRKRWALYPPGRVPGGVTVHVNEEDGDVNIEGPSSLQWWLDVYPHLADHDKPLECTQLPGETIFVPSGWWHCILNLETTIAVTQNFVNRTNFEFVCLDMTPGHHHKGVSRAGLLATHDKHFGHGKKNEVKESNCLNYSNMTRKEKRLKVSEPVENSCGHMENGNAIKKLSVFDEVSLSQDFSYDIEFLASFLDDDRDHYSSIWSPSNCIGPRELRLWLHKLWVVKPEMRQSIWKGACLALNANKLLASVMQICAFHDLPYPLDDEKLPVGTGSNPVFLMSDFVIKIYAEGGPLSSIHALGTELEFYNLLHEGKSPLINHVPKIVASGILVDDDGTWRTIPWDGKGVSDAIAGCGFLEGYSKEDGFSFGIWSKKQFELNSPWIASTTRIWPYLVTKRCRGDIFAHLRDMLPRGDFLHLASFLGKQLRNLHLLPIPDVPEGIQLEVNKICLERGNLKDFSLPCGWKLIVAILESRKKDLLQRLMQWGDPIPKLLIDKVEEYIPHDLSLLVDIFKDHDGVLKVSGPPTWIHSDMMDDNIYMEPSLPALSGSTDTNLAGDDECDSSNGDSSPKKWRPTHILDFSGLSIGDPLYDLIPIHLDIFRGDVCLLKQLLESYGLPLARKASEIDAAPCKPVEKEMNSNRISYRAMCYCILHAENILGAIFSLWKELRTAKSWEEVEEVVWGELNN